MNLTTRQYLFHGTTSNNLKTLLPNKSTHGKSYVYATHNPILAVLFSSNKLGDFGCSIGSDYSGTPFVCERFSGAFKSCYSLYDISIYIVDKTLFFKADDLFADEFVSDRNVPVLEEMRVHDVFLFLKVLELKKELIIYEFPARPACVPSDDSDLYNLRLKKLQNLF
jgi:hypothetical protein